MEIAANIAGLAGTLLLIVPAAYGAWVIRRAAGVAANAGIYEDEALEAKRKEVIEDILSLQSRWNPLLAACLFAGMGLGVFSYILLILREMT